MAQEDETNRSTQSDDTDVSKASDTASGIQNTEQTIAQDASSTQRRGVNVPGHDCIRPLGKGGMAHVWLCHHRKLDLDVAVKVMSNEISADTNFRERFTKEAQALASLNHPNIVNVFNFGDTAGGRPYISMAYLPDGDLESLLKREELDGKRSADIGMKLADALAYAHEHDIVHRDVKPANILMNEGEPVLSDFGIAKSLANTGLTKQQMVMGSTLYMAPEQALGEPVTQAADVFSFGLVFYQMLVGKLPHAKFRVVHTAKHENAIKKALQDVPPAFVDLIIQCLQADPAMRPTARDCHAVIEKQVALVSKSEKWKWIALTSLAASIVLAAYFYIRDSSSVPIAVSPIDAVVYIDGQLAPNRLMPDDRNVEELVVIAPGYIGQLITNLSNVSDEIQLTRLELPSANEIDAFHMLFFNGIQPVGTVIQNHVYREIIELRSLDQNDKPNFANRVKLVEALAKKGDQASSLIYFFLVEEGILDGDEDLAAEQLAASMNSGYALASYYQAMAIHTAHIEKNGNIAVSPNNAMYREYDAALTRAAQQGLADAVERVRAKQEWRTS